MEDKLIKIDFSQRIIKKELKLNDSLINIRQILLDIIIFPFIFLDKDSKEIPKEKESRIKLIEILDDNFLYLKKEIESNRIMQGTKIGTRNGLNIYLYPTKDFTSEEKEKSTNIIVLGKTCTGKTAFLNRLINHIHGIQLEEKNRYILEDKNILNDLNKNNILRFSNTEKSIIYNIGSTDFFNNSIRLIDTPGFPNCYRRPSIDDIFQEIKDFLKNKDIKYINAICLFLQTNEPRISLSIKIIYNKLIELFGNDMKNNLIIVFTFYNNDWKKFTYNELKNKEGCFYECFGDIDNINYFCFDNKEFFGNDDDEVDDEFIEFNEILYKNNYNNLTKFIKHIKTLKPIYIK